MRRLSLFLMGIGVSSEMAAITGMVLGILAGISFMATREPLNPHLFWLVGAVCCILRIGCIRLDAFLHHQTSQHSAEEIFFNELPERVSDAVTIIGFGFAASSSPWLGLASALAAIFSAYMRSLGVMRGAGKKRSSSGPMTRIHRLALISLTSALMLFPITGRLVTPIPHIALWVMLFGCLATILLRWFKLKEFDET